MAVLIERLGKRRLLAETADPNGELPVVTSGPDVKLAPSETGKILVVEDNQANRELLARRLTSEGHTVVTAENGRIGLREVAAKDFDLVLLDIVMPEVDGLQVLERLKADERLRDIPVIMISALDEVASAVRCIATGAEDYLSKPFDPVLLRARIGACLEKKRMRDREKMHLAQIEAERRRSDELLHVILPDEIVQELRLTNMVEPRRHESVAVLFADIVGFTQYCDTHAPEDVVDDLQRLVEAWEEIALQCEVQKIKTIGDAFMAAAGLLKPLDNPVLNCARCALKMIEIGRRLTPHWPVRVGIHIGPVVAGVLGRWQYLYDLWGDTVNTAARIQSHALPGAVALSEAGWHRLSDVAEGESLGTVELKGKGQVEIMRLVTLKTDL
ncbi:MAG: response regulator [Planctomycetes bacterium]|nr:response regulator [Planctomycetota bacterium]